MQLAELKKPFDPKRISWRVGSTNADKTSGLALAYIDARDVQDRLDEVCGMENWQCRYALQDKTTICEIGVKIGDEWVWKADGAGSTDVEAEKGSLSDAFKRAAVKWGVGRYLYEVDSPWVKLEAAGRSYKIASGEKAKLEAVLRGAAVPKAEPEMRPAPQEARITGEIKTASTAPRITPEAWAKDAVALVKRLSQTDLDEWSEKNNAAMVKLRASSPNSHTDLMAAIRDRYAMLEPMGAG